MPFIILCLREKRSIPKSLPRNGKKKKPSLLINAPGQKGPLVCMRSEKKNVFEPRIRLLPLERDFAASPPCSAGKSDRGGIFSGSHDRAVVCRNSIEFLSRHRRFFSLCQRLLFFSLLNIYEIL
ncbi:hypothetical protein CDAR_294631 [Caerostris darwini]|uniref:Uncharacterized protein n=1 Tax=Caerostris darwini TaxID=1538125 RepID=A0AAV4UKM2_9ARAC|nr:hypothetical protein CDAR_294631 [Caerostris darwini]